MITNFKIFEEINDVSKKQEVIDFIISKLDKNFDYGLLKLLLNKINRRYLIASLPEEDWDGYKHYHIDDVIEIVINDLYIDRHKKDYTLLDELLNFISEEDLIKSIPKTEWENYLLKKETDKFNL